MLLGFFYTPKTTNRTGFKNLYGLLYKTGFFYVVNGFWLFF